MPDRLTFVAGAINVFVGVAVLVGWAFGTTAAASFANGWRVMVPSTAFSFVAVGLSLTAASRLRPDDRTGATLIRCLAIVASVVPLMSVTEYFFQVRFGVESWLGI